MIESECQSNTTEIHLLTKDEEASLTSKPALVVLPERSEKEHFDNSSISMDSSLLSLESRSSLRSGNKRRMDHSPSREKEVEDSGYEGGVCDMNMSLMHRNQRTFSFTSSSSSLDEETCSVGSIHTFVSPFQTPKVTSTSPTKNSIASPPPLALGSPSETSISIPPILLSRRRSHPPSITSPLSPSIHEHMHSLSFRSPSHSVRSSFDVYCKKKTSVDDTCNRSTAITISTSFESPFTRPYASPKLSENLQCHRSRKDMMHSYRQTFDVLPNDNDNPTHRHLSCKKMEGGGKIESGNDTSTRPELSVSGPGQDHILQCDSLDSSLVPGSMASAASTRETSLTFMSSFDDSNGHKRQKLSVLPRPKPKDNEEIKSIPSRIMSSCTSSTRPAHSVGRRVPLRVLHSHLADPPRLPPLPNVKLTPRPLQRFEGGADRHVTDGDVAQGLPSLDSFDAIQIPVHVMRPSEGVSSENDTLDYQETSSVQSVLGSTGDKGLEIDTIEMQSSLHKSNHDSDLPLTLPTRSINQDFTANDTVNQKALDASIPLFPMLDQEESQVSDTPFGTRLECNSFLSSSINASFDQHDCRSTTSFPNEWSCSLNQDRFNVDQTYASEHISTSDNMTSMKGSPSCEFDKDTFLHQLHRDEVAINRVQAATPDDECTFSSDQFKQCESIHNGVSRLGKDEGHEKAQMNIKKDESIDIASLARDLDSSDELLAHYEAKSAVFKRISSSKAKLDVLTHPTSENSFHDSLQLDQGTAQEENDGWFLAVPRDIPGMDQSYSCEPSHVDDGMNNYCRYECKKPGLQSSSLPSTSQGNPPSTRGRRDIQQSNQLDSLKCKSSDATNVVIRHDECEPDIFSLPQATSIYDQGIALCDQQRRDVVTPPLSYAAFIGERSSPPPIKETYLTRQITR